MSNSAIAIRNQAIECSFGFYTEYEIKKLSVKRITSPQAFDNFKNPLSGGLYDTELGPTEFSAICPTCGSNQSSCPGHIGRIELHLPVYHPLLMPLLFSLLRAKCMFCHRFRLQRLHLRLFQIKIQLVDMGKLKSAMLLGELVMKESKKKQESGNQSSKISRILNHYEQMIETARAARKTTKALQDCSGRHGREFRRQIMADFIKSLNIRECGHCTAISPPLRKDAHNKIFQKKLSKSSRSHNTAHGIGDLMYLSSALQSGGGQKSADDSDSEPEDEVTVRVDEKITEADTYLHTTEVMLQMEQLWKQESESLSLIVGNATDRAFGASTEDTWKIFFIRTIAVPPPRFRPPMNMGDMMAEHPQNVLLSQILSLNEQLGNVRLMGLSKDEEVLQEQQGSEHSLTAAQISRMASIWIELQTAVNVFMDSSKSLGFTKGDAPPGIKQLLERKEGLFRKHMMGKRVNYACRSVISPDPYIGAGEIGLPLRFAMVLTFPQPVTPWNVVHLRKLVENGPNTYPGANFVENRQGQLMDLGRLALPKRRAAAAQLLSHPGQKVWRHLVSGDVVLMNRQPTLHKPGIMAHRARVLLSPEMQTIRMHYANCNTYNADFDGDEMNCHFPQDQLSRAEAYTIAGTECQYIVPTSGAPIRGLIQDHVCSGVKLTSKGTFLDREMYQHLVISALTGLPGLEIVPPGHKLESEQPCILKPRLLWSGKQVISTVLKHLTAHQPPLFMEGKAKTAPSAFGPEHLEDVVIVRGSELLTGVLDKASFGATTYGLVHAVYELVGPEGAAHLLTAFGRLFTIYLQFAGHTCGIEDLTLTSKADQCRANLINRARCAGKRAMQTFCFKGEEGAEDLTEKASIEMTSDEIQVVQSKTEEYLAHGDTAGKGTTLDTFMQGQMAPFASEIIKACLPNGLEKRFPSNAFSLMVMTGAKGSTVNQSQISAGLGQQALEGRRVPMMVSGKTLPSFEAYDPDPRAGGFITDRFLTGIKPQEYYFHCMAGREGLVDTAVKTSRSGYLQRCLIKHLEELTVAYDHTVRDSEGSVIQFLYGEDGIDTVNAKYLSGEKEIQFIESNYKCYRHKLFADESAMQEFNTEPASKLHNEIMQHLTSKTPFFEGMQVLARRLKSSEKKWKLNNLEQGRFEGTVIKVREKKGKVKLDILFKDGSVSKKVPIKMKVNEHAKAFEVIGRHLNLVKAKFPDPVLGMVSSSQIGAVSEKVQCLVENYLKKKGDTTSSTKLSADHLKRIVWQKYMRCLAQPGEAVGSIAAQSIGEPSTQMTLNTFHLAGHGGANVTLGIPRLREIIMTASQKTKTPMITVPLTENAPKAMADAVARRLSQLPLSQLLRPEQAVAVTETIRQGVSGFWERQYEVTLNFVEQDLIRQSFALEYNEISGAVRKIFIAKLLGLINSEMRRAGEKIGVLGTTSKANASQIEPEEAEDEKENETGEPEPVKKKKKGKDFDEEDDDDEEAQGTLKFGRKNEVAGYGEMDDDEKEMFAADNQEDVVQEDAVNPDNDIEDTDQEVANSVKRSKAFTSVQEDKDSSSITIVLIYPASTRRLLMRGLAEQAANVTLVRSSPGISRAFVTQKEVCGVERPAVSTEGSDFTTLWQLGEGILDFNYMTSNDIWAICQTYGVEAARQTIVHEIIGVFGVYGIAVDPRHLALLADYMTFEGGFRPLNRMGMVNDSSPYLQMSFETTCSFLLQAATNGRTDNLQSTSARLVMGQVPKAGTGCFDLLMPVPALN